MTWHDTADWSLVPDHLRTSLKRYVEEGRVPGDLLEGILTNELDKTVDSCKGDLFAQVPTILAFIRMHVPLECYGSGERVAFWEHVGGHEGLRQMAEARQ